VITPTGLTLSRRTFVHASAGGISAALATPRHNALSAYVDSASSEPYFDLEPDVRLHYEELGEGRPVVFLAGWTASSRAFHRQLSLFGDRYHAIALDYRAHGQSTQTLVGHSLSGYARDLRAFLVGRDLHGVVLVGHSMGAFVAWQYLRQFGSDRLAGFVNIDQPPCDSRRPDWPYGDDLLDACQFVVSIQVDQAAATRQLLDLIFKEPPPPVDVAWMLAEMLRVPPPVAGATLLDDITYDARPLLPQITLPTLLCWGRHSALSPLATGEFIAKTQPNARLVIFEESGHCPFLEEPSRFHDEVARFIAGL
jgi:non-heme chloroperoxidase